MFLKKIEKLLVHSLRPIDCGMFFKISISLDIPDDIVINNDTILLYVDGPTDLTALAKLENDNNW